MRLAPDDHVAPDAFPAAQRALVADAAWASVTGACSGGVILVAFALALGADARQVGLLAAIPFIAQLAQLPATVLVERLRQRRKIAVLTITAARVLIALLAAVAFLPPGPVAMEVLMTAQVVIAVLGAVGGCAVNSWLHHLVPRERLGDFFSRRLFWGTSAACVGTVAAGWVVEHLPVAQPLHAYAMAFGVAGFAGLVSSAYLARAPEPRMAPPAAWTGLGAELRVPFEDRNFRRLLVFLGAWNVASNLSAPFLTVFLIRQLDLPLTLVTGMWAASQVANAFTLYAWGRLSDRLTNKAILATALPVHFLCMLALSRVQEGEEISERTVIRQFAIETLQTADNLSSLGGTVGAIFPFIDRLMDRLVFWADGAAPRDAGPGPP